MKKWIVILFLCSGISCKNEKKESEVVAVQHTVEVQESISRGASVYNNFCASCHLAGGEGIEGVFPPLKGSDWLSEQPEKSIHAIKFGISGPIEVNGQTYDNLMPALGLTDQEIADVMNYISASWGNQLEEPISPEKVGSIKK